MKAKKKTRNCGNYFNFNFLKTEVELVNFYDFEILKTPEVFIEVGKSRFLMHMFLPPHMSDKFFAVYIVFLRRDQINTPPKAKNSFCSSLHTEEAETNPSFRAGFKVTIVCAHFICDYFFTFHKKVIIVILLSLNKD